jgi:hypothetical protein
MYVVRRNLFPKGADEGEDPIGQFSPGARGDVD